MSDVFVVSVSAGSEEKQPRLAYNNIASTSTLITASHDNDNTGYLYDGMTTLKWRPANAAPTVQFDGSFADTDFVGISGVNWESAGCSVVLKDSGANVLGSVSGLKDNQPVLFIFDKATYTELLFEFTCSNTLLEVGEIYFGESLQFPRNVSVGYSPGRWKSNDIITAARTEANQFAGSTIRARGTTENFSINFIPIDFIESDYKTFIDNAKGLPVFFLWDKNNKEQAVFGHWEQSAPTYERAYLSSISLTIRGVA